MEYQSENGFAAPLGVSKKSGGINFALFSEHATAVTLFLYTPGEEHPFLTIPLDPHKNKTGQIWHVFIKNPPAHIEYNYSIDGPHEPEKGFHFDPSRQVTDPYALTLSTPSHWGEKGHLTKANGLRARVLIPDPFDWGETVSPKIPMKDLIIYEMHVRSFTQHASSKVSKPGTFLGIIEKIPYLKKLGINAIELMPIFEFDENENHLINPKNNERLFNFWGYSTINFFSPMNRFASSSDWQASINEFKTLVKELHKNNIEVILDVVYNHTAEGNEEGPTLSFRGIDNSVYYILGEKGEYMNFTGTGNTFNCNHPVVSQFILDSLRYWVSEMHVDGFRFDLASILTRDENGAPLAQPPVIKAISEDPVLANTKLIAEAWDAAGLYQVGSFPSWGKWCEWNGQYRDIVRKFIKGTDGQAGNFSRVISGSQHLYGKDRKPYHSINFVTAHDGYTLQDLVTYQQKHNWENGENNRDGANDNESWNCGVEGPTKNHKIIQLRKQQRKNFHLALMLSIGTPMVLMGDEYGHTRLGNNNSWSHDDELNWFLWDHIESDHDFFRFYTLAVSFRNHHSILRRTEFLTDKDVIWHSKDPGHPDWRDESRFVACTLIDHEKMQNLYIAFNAGFYGVHVQLPAPPVGKKWHRIADTALASPNDFVEDPQKSEPIKFTYNIEPNSALLAKAF